MRQLVFQRRQFEQIVQNFSLRRTYLVDQHLGSLDSFVLQSEFDTTIEGRQHGCVLLVNFLEQGTLLLGRAGMLEQMKQFLISDSEFLLAFLDTVDLGLHLIHLGQQHHVSDGDHAVEHAGAHRHDLLDLCIVDVGDLIDPSLHAGHTIQTQQQRGDQEDEQQRKAGKQASAYFELGEIHGGSDGRCDDSGVANDRVAVSPEHGRIAENSVQDVRLSIKPISEEDIRRSMSTRISMRSSSVPRPIR